MTADVEPPRRRGLTLKGVAIAGFFGALIGVAIISIVVIAVGRGGSGHQAAIPPAVDQSPPPEVAASGSITVDRDEVDLGEVPLGTTVYPEFVVTNAGDTPLVIRDVRVRVVQGCCPSRPEVAATEIAPGASTTIRMPMMMHDNMGGPHLFELVVYTSDPAHPEYVLRIRGNFV